MAEFGIDFNKHEAQEPVANPVGASLRHWAGIIASADYFLGCDKPRTTHGTRIRKESNSCNRFPTYP